MQDRINERVDGFRFRMAAWSAFALLVTVGFGVTVVLLLILVNQGDDQTFFLKEWLGAAGAVAFLSVSGCATLLLLILAGLMVWRNSAAIRTEQRHLEMMTAQQRRLY